jgi:hypothetical protein
MLIDQGNVSIILGNGFSALVPSEEWICRVVLADVRYLTVSADFLYEAIRTDPLLSPKRYTREIFDCDDFALALKTKMAYYAQNNKLEAPFAVGFILTQQHAFNFCIDDAQNIVLIDTQYDDKPPEIDQARFASYLNLSARGNFIQVIYV